MDPVEIELLGNAGCAVAPLIAATDVLEAPRASFERHTLQGPGAEL